jgi:hypothetical protein
MLIDDLRAWFDAQLAKVAAALASPRRSAAAW